MNKKENCQNSSEREQHIEVKRTVNQKSTSQKKVNQKSMSQEKANQKSMSQKKANQSGEKSVYDENRDALSSAAFGLFGIVDQALPLGLDGKENVQLDDDF